ncbi:MAG: HEPN domain-containing protein [Candidatus Omnitrophica bacterium]|nr:HEPN domain-containing protein [Candidatus Omnitrophota bacterium]
MSFEKFVAEYLEKGLLKKQKPDTRAVEKMIIRAQKDLKAAKANLKIDEEISYTVSYTAMLHAARAFILLKGYRPTDGYQHKTAVEFMSEYLGDEHKRVIEHFDRMRRNRNTFTYEVSLSISMTEAENAVTTAGEFVELVGGRIHHANQK